MSTYANIVSPAILFGLMAGVPAVLAEFLYKTWDPARPWVEGLWMWVPIQLTIGYSVYRLVTIPDMTILDAFVVFALCTSLLRIILSTAILHQDVRVETWIAFGLVVAASCVRTFWRS